jgi:predicted nucleic acid-binding protein
MMRRPSRPNRLLVDTSAYFAMADRHDPNHSAASELNGRIVVGRLQPFTTNFVVAETHALLLNRLERYTARRMLHAIDRGATIIVRVSTRDERRARQIIDQYADKNFSLTDATSFAVMERLRIGTAFTFDHNFAQYGFQLLSP